MRLSDVESQSQEPFNSCSSGGRKNLHGLVATCVLSLGAVFAQAVSANPSVEYDTASTSADATLIATVSVAALPTTITLCRDPNAYAAEGGDETWQMYINVDNKTTTGSPGTGYDAVIVIQTNTTTSSNCIPTMADTESSLIAAVEVWDASQGTFVLAPIAPTLSFDFSRSTMTVTVPAGGPFAGISSSSPVRVAALATYTGAAGATAAEDSTAGFKFGNGVVDATNDVGQCASPCSSAASYYPLIDLVGASLGDVIFQSSFE